MTPHIDAKIRVQTPAPGGHQPADITHLGKIELADIKPSSRVSPYIKFDPEGKLHRNAVEIENLGHGFDEPLFDSGNLILEAGARLAIVGENGVN